MEVANKINTKNVYFTHISHNSSHNELNEYRHFKDYALMLNDFSLIMALFYVLPKNQVQKQRKKR